jgi:hypothetical protein
MPPVHIVRQPPFYALRAKASHADLAITARYDRRGEVTKQAAAALLDLPPIRRTLPLDED